DRLGLMRKYSCIVLSPADATKKAGMIKKVLNFIAFGELGKKDLEELIEKRGQPIDKSKKVDVKKAAEEIEKGKKYDELNLKPFFRLHPPRKGIDSKFHFGKGKGVLGNNKDKINELLRRML
ncbi:MAG: 50S ribosomal protein L30, partial [Nanoarchaeota archaeon]|nr:50S ribosomal protein L30 [Nanoarchaeota archaeon]